VITCRGMGLSVMLEGDCGQSKMSPRPKVVCESPRMFEHSPRDSTSTPIPRFIDMIKFMIDFIEAAAVFFHSQSLPLKTIFTTSKQHYFKFAPSFLTRNKCRSTSIKKLPH
jgi:hypothetical protein